jgi:hypothetical protein
MKKSMKSAVVMMLALGVLLASVAPSALAQGKCRDRRRVESRYEQDRYYNSRYYDDRDYRDRDYDYRYRENGTGQTVKRVGIGAGIGAVAGALIGGKKGALIGAGVGAAGGYIYHRNKRDRYRY